MNSFKAWIPVSINIDEILEKHPPKKKLKKDKILYIIHLLRTLQTEDRRNMIGGIWILLNATALKNVINNYQDYISYLEDANIIECDGKYKKGVRSNGYKFTSINYILVPMKSVWLKDKTLLKGLKKAWEKDNHGTEYVKRHLPYLHKHFYNGKLTIELPKNAIIQYQSSRAIDSIKSGTPRLSIDKFGRRLHTPITRLNKELRKHLRYDGKELVEVDIKCSQPYLSIKFMLYELNKKNENLINNIKAANTLEAKMDIIKDLKGCDGFYEYVHDILIDDLYIKLKGVYEANNEYAIGNGEREDYKEIIFQIMYSKNGYKNNLKTSFKELYPYPYNTIYKLKKNNYKDLAQKLQKLESMLVLRTVCKEINKLNKHIPMFTIHDSILTTKEHEETVRRVMKEVLLGDIGFEPELNKKL